MTIPTHEEAMLPVLEVLRDGEARHRNALADTMATHFTLSTDERIAMLPSGKATVIQSRTHWALTYLKQAGLLQSPKRGWYAISPLGIQTLATRPKHIDNEFLMQFQGFLDFRSRTRSTENDGASTTEREARVPEVAPDEALVSAYGRLRGAIEAEVLDALSEVAPSLFEEIVIDLLVQMGYGGSRAEAARAIGRTGDGGIDGVIDEDRLGLDVIYVQAKRWQGSVGRPEIQKFAGALQGQRATKGIFITTSSFTGDAEEYAQRIGTRIVLVDGRRLANLMYEFDVGVTPRNTYTVKSLDSDYFEGA